MWRRLLIIPLMIVFYACATPKAAPSLSLQYTSTSRSQGNNIALMMTTPSYTGSPQVRYDANKEIGPDDTIPYIYASDYSGRLQNFIQQDLEKIFIAKGYTLARRSDVPPENPSPDRQKIDLLVITTFDFGPDIINSQRVLRYPTGSTLIMNEGTLALTGGITITFADPLTKKAIIVKKVDMASINADIPIEYEDQTDAEYKFTELINKIYPRLLGKIEKSINTEEILAGLNNFKILREKSQPIP